MKHGLKPTKKQKVLIASRKLDPDNWLVERDTVEKMIIVHRVSGKKMPIYKGEM